MAVTAKMYTSAMQGFIKGTYKWATTGGSAFKIGLLSGYTPNQDAHTTWTEVKAAGTEASGTGYTAGGAALTTTDPTVDTASNETRMDAADVTWGSSTITASYACIYEVSTGACIGYIDFGGAQVSSNDDFKIVFDTTGVFKITAS